MLTLQAFHQYRKYSHKEEQSFQATSRALKNRRPSARFYMAPQSIVAYKENKAWVLSKIVKNSGIGPQAIQLGVRNSKDRQDRRGKIYIPSCDTGAVLRL